MKALGYLYVVPVALTCVVMLAIAMLNNVFLCWTNKRRYPAGGNMKLLCDVFKRGTIEREIPEGVLRTMRKCIKTRKKDPPTIDEGAPPAGQASGPIV